VNTWHIIRRLWKEYPGIKTVVPKMTGDDHQMVSCLLDATTRLTTTRYAVPEPQNPQEVDEALIDIVLAPMLVCDRSGNRVGYGKGYYDTFFKKCRKDVVKTGLSFFEPVTAIDDVAAWDERLDQCITPLQVYRFSD
jgi:5-formyltetrahydrofolate cyclo-ligase